MFARLPNHSSLLILTMPPIDLFCFPFLLQNTALSKTNLVTRDVIVRKYLITSHKVLACIKHCVRLQAAYLFLENLRGRMNENDRNLYRVSIEL